MGYITEEDELLQIDDSVWVIRAEVGVPNYDFAFDRLFPCRHPWAPVNGIMAVARVGAIPDYPSAYKGLLAKGIRLVHNPDQYRRSSELAQWYPLLEDLTPESRCYDSPPDSSEVGDLWGWPLFIKGERQTSRHQKELSIVGNPEEYKRAVEAYQKDPILRWQKMVCRRYVPLRPVVGEEPVDRIPRSFEFRTFWWNGQLACYGPYWFEGENYFMTPDEESAALGLSREAARRVNLPFLVVDIAQAKDGRWLVIECNDGQESGYAGASPISLWQKVISCEKGIRA